MANRESETPAQRAARERNLKKGNPNAYSVNRPGPAKGEVLSKQATPSQGGAQGAPREPDPVPAAQGAAQGAPREDDGLFRGKPAQGAAKGRPRAPRTKPAAPAQGGAQGAPREPDPDPVPAAQGAAQGAPRADDGLLDWL